jgi:hypothetical protein
MDMNNISTFTCSSSAPFHLPIQTTAGPPSNSHPIQPAVFAQEVLKQNTQKSPPIDIDTALLENSDSQDTSGTKTTVAKLSVKSDSTKTLLEEAESFYQIHGPFHPVDTSGIEGASGIDVIDQLFSRFQGICIGEHHFTYVAMSFIIRNMDFFKKSGVTNIFIEHFYDNFQEQLDRYLFKGEPFKDSTMQNMFSWAKKYPSSISEYHIALAAAERGIRVVCIDTNESSQNGKSENDYRLKTMNYFAANIIHREKGDGKFIAFMGSGHLNTYYEICPGVAELTQTPSILIPKAGSFARNQILYNHWFMDMQHNFVFSIGQDH